MNIVMVTNTHLPHVGGVARSVDAFTREYRSCGHRVLVIAPEFAERPLHEPDVVRVQAIQHFNGSDFSMVLPLPKMLGGVLDAFQPDLIHSHHPYLLGTTALRIARYRNLPLVFTHHTLYEQYTHYVPANHPAFKRFIVELATSYANRTELVFSPSQSIAHLLRRRGVNTPIKVVPTGIPLADFAAGEGAGMRHQLGIPAEALVIGHVGRLAPEKKLEFLAKSVARVLLADQEAHFLVVGEGPSESMIQSLFQRHGLGHRLHCVGFLDLPLLADAYHAMDLFAFSSLSETQGLVLVEAMAAGLPVVALDANGVREIVKDSYNGYLLRSVDSRAFAERILQFKRQTAYSRQLMSAAARATAAYFSLSYTADLALFHYKELHKQGPPVDPNQEEHWERLLNVIKNEWEIIKDVTGAAGVALARSDAREAKVTKRQE